MSNRSSLRKGIELQVTAPVTILPTGIASIDRLLSGGLQRGSISEIVGPLSSGKTSLVFSILSQATSQGELTAYIDPFASLDPAFASRSGIDLHQLLWVYGTPFSWEQALKAADILTRAGIFGVIVLDLAGGKPRVKTARPFPLSSWFRLQRAIRGTSTIFLLLGSHSHAGSAASLSLSLHRHEIQWSPGSSGPPHACRLDGLSSRVEVTGTRRAASREGKQPNHATFRCRL